jgi:hypothetical protein
MEVGREVPLYEVVKLSDIPRSPLANERTANLPRCKATTKAGAHCKARDAYGRVHLVGRTM